MNLTNHTRTRFKSKRRIVFIAFLFLSTLSFIGIDGHAQTSLETLIESSRKNNKALIAAQQYYQAEVMEAKTGNSPDNPELEYAYLWGNPEQVGDRVDFSVTQSFDFPTAYSSRSKLSKITREQAALRLKLTEQDLMVQAHKSWALAVYLNQKNLLLGKRLDNAQLIANAFQRMFEEGEANQLQFNQVRLKVTAITNEISRLQIDILKNNAILSRLSGGDRVNINDITFPLPGKFTLDSLIDLYQLGPQNAAFQGEVVRREQLKAVTFNQKLPKLKAGYYQETILGVQLKGITAGITIPLWENAHKVKSAKAGLVFAESDAIRFWQEEQLEVKQMYSEWALLKEQVHEMQELLKYSNNEMLLQKALEGGEISLTQYHYESDFYFQNQFDLLDFQRDLYLIEAELLSVTY